MLLAGVFGVAAIGTVTFFMLRPGGSSGPVTDAPPPPDAIEDLLAPGQDRGKGMTIQIADKDDPTRLAAEVLAARYEPDGPMHRRVEEPRAWLFGEDGSTWYIEADRGRFFIPEGAETPSEGFLEGNVRARRYAALVGGRPNPEVESAELTATTDEALRFNLEMLHFETEGRLEITSDELEFAGHGAYVVLNEQRESISALRVDRGERLVYTPPAKSDDDAVPIENEIVSSQAGEVELRVSDSTRHEDGSTSPDTGNGPVGAEASTRTTSVDNKLNARTRHASTGAGPEPSPDASGNETGRTPSDAAPQVAQIQPTPSGPPKIDVYEIVFEDDVELVAGTRSIDADLLTVWVRLVDGAIPERSAGNAPQISKVPTGSAGVPQAFAALAIAAHADAIAPMGPEMNPELLGPELLGPPLPKTEAVMAGSEHVGSDVMSSELAADSSSESEPQIPESIVLTWEGPLEIFPRDDDADPLSMGDDVALRFEEQENPVRFADAEDGATGRSKSAMYFAGRERVELLGSGGAVELSSPRAGSISGTSSLAIELGSGYVTVPASGVLSGKRPDEDPSAVPEQRIHWDGSAEFRFALENGRMGDRLERASFDGGPDGDVAAFNRDATLEGSRLDALFDSTPGEDARLVQLNVANARADDGRGGTLEGNELEVHFSRGTGSDDIDPTRAIVRGNASAQRAGQEAISADLIDASLARDLPDKPGGSGDIIVTIAEAQGAVEFTDGAGVEGKGETLWADALSERAIIRGDGARVRRDATEISGDQIDLDGPSRRVVVEGAGSFSHTGGDARSIKASWTERMAFDDLKGSLECAGGVNTESVAPDLTRDSATASRLVIELDPYTESETEGSENATDADQRVRRAIVFGTPVEPAVVESRRVAPGSTEDAQRVDELFRLEGAEIRFAARDNRVEVPTAGRLFMLDRRPQTATTRGTQSDTMATPGGQRGTSLFTWEGSLSFDRNEGRATFDRNVRAANKPLDGTALTDVISDRLIAAFAIDQSDTENRLGTGDAISGDLLWAEAVGKALLTSEGRREISADRLLYDAAGGQILATGKDGQRVGVRDLVRGTSSTFTAMRWDLGSDTIEFINPGSIVTPE